LLIDLFLAYCCLSHFSFAVQSDNLDSLPNRINKCACNEVLKKRTGKKEETLLEFKERMYTRILGEIDFKSYYPLVVALAQNLEVPLASEFAANAAGQQSRLNAFVRGYVNKFYSTLPATVV